MTYEKAGKVMASGQAFRTRVDARDFTGIWSGPELFLDNYATLGTIRKITYGGEVLYNQNHYRCMLRGFECYAGNACTNDASLCPLVKNPGGVCNLNPRDGPSGVNSNDNFLDTQCVVIKSSFAHPPQAPHDRLEITYRVDGSCERINSFLGKCAKHYVQGQFDSSLMEVDDHSPASRFFKVPTYADTTKQFRVFVDGIQVFEGSDWARSGFKITFFPAHQVFDGQRVRIEYFIDLGGGGEILTSQDAAIEEINTLCGCKNGLRCQLTPVKVSENNTENIVDYACVYSDSSPAVDPPLEQIVYLDSKAVPVRYYDVFGKAQDQVDSSTPPQDGRPFHYLENNPLKPNNVDTFVGFHEIYGTLSSAPQSPFPPLKVSVKAKRAYNIFVNTGQFSSCLNCGRDYYSALNRLFPDAFDDPGGGLIPDPFQTSRFRPSRWGMHLRSDDLLFGRACFAPATMIPWTHRPYSDINRQRRSRQLAQHFLFANGYQRDWYGFDYGSVIGSFDGAHWFSVGHERQITATSNKLYLAVNAYFGDLTLGGGYSVRISEVVGQPLGQMIPKSDKESSGAECQRYHQCDHDQDCITQLGWDYVCTDVQGIKTPWPIFDENAMELPDSSTTLSLRSLVGRTPAPSKRCVYRGRGAICHKDYGSQDNGTSYAAQGLTRLNGCSANHWCADIKSDSVFNQKLARFAASPGRQNASSEIPDSLKERHSPFGLGARIIGRPFHYNGTDPLTPGISSHFSANKIQGLCVPGRVPNGGSLSYEQQHGTRPGRLGNADNGDRVGNIGMTQTGNMATPDYYNSCPMLDDNGQLYAFENPTANIQSEEVGRLSTQQNLSTNVFQTFNNEIQRLIRPFNSIIEQPTLQEARCLRGAGSACFTDMDCGPSPFTRSVFQSLDPQEDAGPLGTNPYELKYWQEELVCAQKAEPYSDYYDLTQNVCCRQTGKKLTIGTRDPDHGGGGMIETRKIAGYSDATAGAMDLDSSSRNTRTHIIFADIQEDGDKFPPLSVAGKDNCGPSSPGNDCPGTLGHPLKQFNTFSVLAERTCCTGHWVREFHKENGGGGHKWSVGKMQSLDKRNLTCLNYSLPATVTSAQECLDTTANCDCTDPDNGNCFIRSIPQREGERYNKFLSTLELTGIPQVLIQNNASQYETDGEAITCVAPVGVGPSLTPAGGPIPGTLSSSHPEDDAEFEDGTTNQFYYKASDRDNFNSSLKQVFSPDEITCCIPPGENFAAPHTPEKACCSGKSTGTGRRRRCCLKDYTNVTVFFNRYVSSILKDLPESHFDPLTGRPRSGEKVHQMARHLNVCCSGRVERGSAFSRFRVPTALDHTDTTRRFVQGDGPNEAILYDLGQRWNTDIYCVP